MPVIEKVGVDKKRFIDLLLLADEQESMIDRYLDRGELFVCHGPDGVPTCVAVVTDEGNGVCELKNIAVVPSCWRKGYGRQMIEYLCCHYGGDFLFMTVGTGDSPQTISFYEHCGFSYSHSLPDFFTLNYDHPIVEGGKVLRDMLYFAGGLPPAPLSAMPCAPRCFWINCFGCGRTLYALPITSLPAMTWLVWLRS